MSTKGQRIKNHFVEWSTRSTSHGYPRIIGSESILIKIMWTAFTLASIGGCAFLIYQSFDDYLKFEVNSKIRSYRRNSMLFPVITVCNINPFLYESSIKLISNFTDYETSFLATINAAASPDFGDENRKSLGMSLKEMIPFRQYNMKDLGKYGNDDFEWYYSTRYGNCYRFNTIKKGQNNSLSYSTSPGPFNGLNLLLFSGPKTKSKLTHNYGMHIFIDNQTDLPSNFDGFDLNPGTANYIAISKSIIRILPPPFSNCNDMSDYRSEIYDFMKDNGIAYSQKKCMDLCFQKIINSYCNCSELLYPSYHSNLTSCKSSLNSLCSEEMRRAHKHEYDSQCSEECPLECETVSFDYTMSSSTLENIYAIDSSVKDDAPGLIKKYFQNRTYDDQEVKNSFTSVAINYDRLEYTIIEETPNQSLWSFISNIGGTLGLFVGVSFLSFIEIVEIAMEILIILASKRTVVESIKNTNQETTDVSA